MRDLLCYAHGSDGSWEAICVDLDIAVQGGTREDVMTRLEEVVGSYIEAALAEEPSVAKQLLARAAPWHVRATHWIRFQVYMFTRKRAHVGNAIEYGIPCPA